MLDNVWGLILIMVLAITFHEIGHLAVLSLYNPDKQIKIHFGWKSIRIGEWKENYAHLTNKQLSDVYIAGILAGLIPILFYVWEYPVHPFYSWGLFGVYLLGCVTDFKSIWSVVT